MSIFIYNLLNILILPFWVLFVIYRCLKGKELISRVGERFGLTGVATGGSVVWIHAASVGESMSVIPLIEKLIQNYPQQTILITSGTVTSAKIIKDKLGNNVIHQFLPIDNYICIKLFLGHWRPKLFIVVDSEFWPCLITQAAKRCPVISLNTRISDRSFLRWKKYKYLLQPLLSSVSMFFPQSRMDLDKLQILGAKNAYYLGNLKYCTSSSGLDNDLLSSIAGLLSGRQVLLAASTHNGEEVVLANIYKKLNLPNSILVIAPRHPVRSKEIELSLQELGLNVAIRSRNENISNSTDIYLADTLGELNYFYKLAPVSIIGNSICYDLGHNPIEAARYGSAIITGPGYSNFKEVYEELFANNGAFMIDQHKEAAKIILDLFTNERLRLSTIKNASKVVSYHQKTLREMLDKLSPYLK